MSTVHSRDSPAMRSTSLFKLLVSFFFTLAHAVQTEHTVDIHAWPLSSANSQSIARISYTPTNATVKSYTPLAGITPDDIIRIGFRSSAGAWSGVATSASNFLPGRDKKVQLHLNDAGELYHVGFAAIQVASSSKSGKAAKGKDGDDVLGVEVWKVQPGPTPHLNKPVVLDAQGKVPEKEVEKTFFQKYWWVIAGFLLLQVVMGGAKE